MESFETKTDSEIVVICLGLIGMWACIFTAALLAVGYSLACDKFCEILYGYSVMNGGN